MAKRAVRNYNLFGQYTYYVPGVADMFILLVWLLVGALLGNIVNLAFLALMGMDAGMEAGLLVSYPIMFIPAMMYAAIKSRKNSMIMDGVKVDSAHFGKYGFLLCALVVIVSTIALAFCGDALTSLMPEMPDFLKETLESMTTGTLWINLLCVSVFAPIFEEWLCRGQVLRGLLNKGIKPVWAIIISAVFFAVIHANPWQAIPAFILGAFFGYVYYRTGSLKLTMIMHCANNTFAVILSHIDKFEDMESWQDVLPAGQYWVIFTACLILVALTILFFNKIELEKKSGNSDVVPNIFDQE